MTLFEIFIFVLMLWLLIEIVSVTVYYGIIIFGLFCAFKIIDHMLTKKK